ncbi:malonate decarboxylase holo-[acyl-carrier-protein] synthase [Limnobacter humi]|uniref:Malonate decarboxylase holo-[acyl-carrier-protein] synthase n=1 Tax=Limnobacter humi TaxID=1778671 RepID=A0ABT1WEP3_9BURK|nr:malonate decarboxylase holo-[acyl-carrier-protein] synthase [Limnobacter humi]MCQ8895207.1 malonate decarboxylase holo-[acyl-carrier-protein] synthase [Limnobacter humi]
MLWQGRNKALFQRTAALAAVPFHRQQLVRIHPEQWLVWARQAAQPALRSLLDHWADNDFPLIVGRQSTDERPLQVLRLGLPAPARFHHRKESLYAPVAQLVSGEPLPALDTLAASLADAPLLRLSKGLHHLDAPAQVYGSLAWELITGEAYRKPDSDLDILIHVEDIAHADQVVDLLEDEQDHLPFRLDGELEFPGHLQMAWREWKALREGRTERILVKSLTRCELLPLEELMSWA